MKEIVFTKAEEENFDWAKLSNEQKTKWFLGSTRMLDFEHFLQEFESYEQPIKKIYDEF